VAPKNYSSTNEVQGVPSLKHIVIHLFCTPY